MAENPSRRKFLIDLGIGAAGTVVAASNTDKIAAGFAKIGEAYQKYELQNLDREFDLANTNPELFDFLTFNPEFASSILETIQFQQKLGFERRLPAELERYRPFVAQRRWENLHANDKFVNGLATNLAPIGEAAQKISETALGVKFAPRLTRGIKTVSQSGGTVFYAAEENRYVGWPGLEVPNTSDIFLTLYHEALGHATDPVDFKAFVPAKIFFEALVGKWQVLSQAFNVEGEFLNHPSDGVTPRVQSELAKLVRPAPDAKKKYPDLENDPQILQLVGQTANELDATPGKLVYTKTFCLRLGKKLMDNVRANKLPVLSPHFQDRIQSELPEIYAEMVKWSLASVELFSDEDQSKNTAGLQTIRRVQKNPDITSGVARILNAVRGDHVSLEEIRARLGKLRSGLPDNIVNLDFSEPLAQAPADNPPGESIPLPETPQIVITAADNEAKTITVPKSELTIDQKETLDTGRLVDDLLERDIILDLSKVPNSDDDKLLLLDFLADIAIIARKYPRFTEVHLDYRESIAAFDPPFLNYWETEAITQAAKKDSLTQLISEIHTGQDIGDFLPHIRESLPILDAFIQRPGFKAAPLVHKT